LSCRGTLAGTCEIRSQVALEPLLRYRPTVAQEAQAHLAVGDDGAPVRGVSGNRPGKDLGNAVATDPDRRRKTRRHLAGSPGFSGGPGVCGCRGRCGGPGGEPEQRRSGACRSHRAQ
jgi:hypothetical protein